MLYVLMQHYLIDFQFYSLVVCLYWKDSILSSRYIGKYISDLTEWNQCLGEAVPEWLIKILYSMMQSSFESQQIDMLTECQTFAVEDEEMCWDFHFIRLWSSAQKYWFFSIFSFWKTYLGKDKVICFIWHVI